MAASIVDQLHQTFVEEYGREPEVIARAPGRVNLIGEHTDYNDGFVLPVAIDRDVRVAVARRDDRRVRLYAATIGRRTQFSVDSIRHQPRERWSHYERGVVLMLQRRGHEVGGFDAVVEGDVPTGAGLSSSAAVEVATGTALNALFHLDVDPVTIALLGQQAENEFVGVKCGIMDQFISALGKRDHALFLDCRTLETRHVPVGGPRAGGRRMETEPPSPDGEGLGVGARVERLEAHPLPEGEGWGEGAAADVQIVVADTAVKRGLVDSEYNRRRAECEEATRLLGRYVPNVTALRDVTSAQFQEYADRLPEVVRRRARHVIGENERVLASVEALERGDVVTFGRLMNESHASLRDDYEVTVPQLDVMVEAARSVPGVLGSRMTGAGFGGCTVSLVVAAAVEDFRRIVPNRYRAQSGLKPRIYVCRAMDGATVLLKRT